MYASKEIPYGQFEMQKSKSGRKVYSRTDSNTHITIKNEHVLEGLMQNKISKVANKEHILNKFFDEFQMIIDIYLLITIMIFDIKQESINTT